MNTFKSLANSKSFVLRVTAEGAELEGKTDVGKVLVNVGAEGFDVGNHILPLDYLPSVLRVVREDAIVCLARDEIGIVTLFDVVEKKARGRKSAEKKEKPELDEQKFLVMLPG